VNNAYFLNLLLIAARPERPGPNRRRLAGIGTAAAGENSTLIESIAIQSPEEALLVFCIHMTIWICQRGNEVDVCPVGKRVRYIPHHLRAKTLLFSGVAVPIICQILAAISM
jgi:hypothetical protein